MKKKITITLGIIAAVLVVIIGMGVAYAAPLSYSTDVSVHLTTPDVTLTILTGSVADAVVVSDSSVTVTMSNTTGGTFVLTSSAVGLSVSITGTGGSVTQTCYDSLARVSIGQISGSAQYAISPTVSACVPAHSPATGGGSSSAPLPTISWKTPSDPASYAPGQTVGLEWQPANGVFVKYALSYSANNGASWNAIAADLTGTSASWTVPDLAITQGKFKVEGYDGSGTLLASAVSTGGFIVTGTAVPPTPSPEGTPPVVDSTATGSYAAEQARNNTPDINTDKNLPPAPPFTAWCVSGSLVKTASSSSVYYCGNDGKRYVFVNDRTYFSWYPDFSNVQTIIEQTMAKIEIGGNVTYRPGSRMVKIQSDPKVYAVSRGGILRWITTEAIAQRLYGANWNRLIDDVPDSFFVNYAVGEPISN